MGLSVELGINNLFKWFRTIEQGGRPYMIKHLQILFYRIKKALGLYFGI